MSTSEDWQIPSRAERCAGCDGDLPPQSEVTVVLRLGGEGPAREDLCKRCGEGVESGAEVFFWRQKVPAEAGRRPVVDYAMLRDVFERMLTRDEEVYRRLCYLVGLVLVRKRHLRLRGFEARDGKEVMIVSRRKDDPELVVPAPYLSAEDMVATREALTRLLAADLTEGDLDLAALASEVAGEAEAGTDTEAGTEAGTDTEAGTEAGTGSGPRPELN